MGEEDRDSGGGGEDEHEGAPEALGVLQADQSGHNDNRRWRYAVEDVQALPFAGPGRWKQVGPAPLLVGNDQRFQGIGPNAGEVVDIAIDPRGGSERTIYVAAGSGGVWKSTDDGLSWRPITDQLPADAVGAIAIDPGNPDILYVGTGNLFEGAGGMSKAAGLFKSRDAGKTWARLNGPLRRPRQAITAATNVPGGVNVTVAGHGYVTGDRVAAVGLPGIVGSANEGAVQRVNDNTLRIGGLTMNAAYGGAGAFLFDARQVPFLCDSGIIRMVCPLPDTLLVASETGLYYSRDGGRNFGANHPDYDDGRPLRGGLISALEIDQGSVQSARVADATPASPIVVTVPAHGFVNDDRVHLGGVTSNQQANGTWSVDRIDDDHFSLRGSTGNGTGAVTGFVVGPTHPSTQPVQGASNPAAPQPIVITAPAHGFITGDVVAVSGVEGNTAANGSWPIRVLSPDTFALFGSRGNGAATANTGVVDGPRHRAPVAITAAVNAGGGITITAAGHGLVDGDRVTVNGLPGVVAPNNSGSVRVLGAPDQFRVAGLTMNAAYGGAGATVVGPADAWNTVYFVSAGRVPLTNALNPDRGLFRLTIASNGRIAMSPNLLSNAGGPAAFGRVAFAQSQGARTPAGQVVRRTSTVYVSVQDNEVTPVYIGFFRSPDFGATWTVRPALATPVNADGAGQSDYDLTIGVDPQDAGRVYAALQQLWRSTDAGVTWPPGAPATGGGIGMPEGLVGPTALTTSNTALSPSTTLLHFDHHELVFPPSTRWTWNAGNPDPITPLYLGTDGGAARATTNAAGLLEFAHLNEGVATSLLRGIDIGRGAGNNAVTFGGMQDTGTAGHRRSDIGATWVAGVDGDGGRVAVDPANPDIVFTLSGNNLARTTNGGQTWFGANIVGRPQIVSVLNENPVRVVTTGHAFQTGIGVTVSGVPGGGGLANGFSVITVPPGSTTDFTLNGKNGTAVAAFGAGPQVHGGRFLTGAAIVAATLTSPIEIETEQPHGCAANDRVRIDAVEGNVAANNTDANPSWTVAAVLSPTRISLTGSDGTSSNPYVAGTGRLRGPRSAPATIPVLRAERTTPIVVTAAGHGFVSGDQVTVTGVLGNTNANCVGNPIRVLDANSFELVGLAGNAAFVAGPAVVGPTLASNLPVDPFCRVSLVPNGANPAQTIFASFAQQLFRSTDGGLTYTLINAFADNVTYIHSPAANRLWIGTAGNATPFRPGRVLFSNNGGTSFATGTTTDIGARGSIACITEDPRDGTGQRVAVVVSGYSESVTQRRTRHCFLTTTGGQGATPWAELGGVQGAGVGNLPDIPVLSVAWDTSTNPSTLLVATDVGVLKLGPGNVWQRIGPNLPKISCQTLAVDNTDLAHPLIRVGTYGRSTWEFTVPAGPHLEVEADLGFGEQAVGTTTRRRLVLHSVGDADLSVASIGLAGDFTLDPPPAFPLAIPSGEHRGFDVVFAPAAAGEQAPLLEITSNDADAGLIHVKASAVAVAAGTPRLQVRAFLEFGTVRSGAPATFPVVVTNPGNAPLVVDHVDLDAAGNPRFSLPTPPGLPATIPPGGSLSIDVRFDPIANGLVRTSLVIQGSGQAAVVNIVGRGTTSAAGMFASLLNTLGITDENPEVLV